MSEKTSHHRHSQGLRLGQEQELPDRSRQEAMAAHHPVILHRPRPMDSLLPTSYPYLPPGPTNFHHAPTTVQETWMSMQVPEHPRQCGFLSSEHPGPLYPVASFGGVNIDNVFIPSSQFDPSAFLRIAQAAAAMRVPVDPAFGQIPADSTTSTSPSPGASMCFDNVGALFGDYSGHPGQFALHRDDSPPQDLGAELPATPATAAAPAPIYSSQSPPDSNVPWDDGVVTDGLRVAQQNSRLLSYSRSPGGLAGDLPIRRGPPSTSSVSMKDGTSPSDSTASSWVHLTPTTGSPGPDSDSSPAGASTTPPRVRREETLRRSETHAVIEPKAGPTREWKIPEKKKRGRKPGTGAISKDRRAEGASKKTKLVAKRLGPLSDKDREQARLTKKHGACRVCHYKKSKCPPIDPNHPEKGCKNCLKLQQDWQRPRPSPCFRYAITDASLYRQQKKPYYLWTQRWQSMEMKDITTWDTNEIRTITVTQIFLHAPYELKVRKYIPEAGDQLERFWFDGKIKRRMDIPAYAIANLEEAATAIDQMMARETVNYFDSTIRLLKGTGHPGLLWTTYNFAHRHCAENWDTDEGNLLKDTLKLWMACRLTSYSEKIISEDTLGMTFVDDPSSPYKDRIPVPPIMVAQQELIMYSRYLQPLSNSVLQQLDRLIAKRKHGDWLTIYLTLFLLLHSCALLTERDAEYAQRLGLDEQFANPASIRGHHCGALTLLAHFHFVSGGPRPFDLAAQKRLQDLRGNTSFTLEQERFVEESAMCVNMMRNELRAARESGDPGNTLYWISQLYDTEWRSDKMH